MKISELAPVAVLAMLAGCSQMETDPFIGQWNSGDRYLVIEKIGSDYIIHSRSSTGGDGLIYGDWAAAREGNHLQTRQQLLGDATVTGETLYWAGLTFQKAQ